MPPPSIYDNNTAIYQRDHQHGVAQTKTIARQRIMKARSKPKRTPPNAEPERPLSAEVRHGTR
jgi:hypothetical protein